MHILSVTYKKISVFMRERVQRTLPRLAALRHRYWGVPAKIASVVLIGFVLLAIVRSIFGAGIAEVATVNARSVVVAPAATSLAAVNAYEVTGEVVSQTQGDLRTQATGIVTLVKKSVSEHVPAGAIIVIIENAAERAGVAQARAGVAQAQAAYNKVSGGTRSEQLAVLAATTQRALEAQNEAQVSARNTLLSAYASANSVFAGGIDAFFNDATGANPTLTFSTTSGTDKTRAEHKRFLLQGNLNREDTMVDTAYELTGDTLLSEISTLETEVRAMKEMLDTLISALDGAVPSASIDSTTIATYRATATAGRTTLLNTLSALSSTRTALNSAHNAVVVAQENEALGVAGAQNEDVAAAQAQLDAATAGLAQAYARLEDTYVRAPVSGIITRLSVKPGDFVQAYQDVGLVANTNALEVQTFVSVETAQRVNVGDTALIDNAYDGVVTSIADSIDPTKRQIEIHIAFVDDTDDTIPTGVRVPVAFSASVANNATSTIIVPITALKLTGSKAYVFTVDEMSIVHAVPVTLGDVVQNAVEIISGVQRDTNIVIDARSLNEGDSVIITNR